MINASLNIAPASLSDYRELARKKLPKQFFDYIDGGAFNESTARQNVKAFESLLLRQKVLRDVSEIDQGVELLGERLSMPLVLAPVGLAGCFARRGEVQAYRAASQFGIPFCLSTVSICSIEELSREQLASFWFQLYVIRDRQYSIALLKRAEKAGCKNLVFTVDLPVVGERYRDTRNGLGAKSGVIGKLKQGWDLLSHPRWLWDVPLNGKPLVFGNLTDAVPGASTPGDFKYWVDHQFDPSVTWEDLSWIRDNWSGNLIIKGILDGDDAKRAVAVGTDALVVSNHGGRQLDSAPASLSVLPEITRAVNGNCKILFDGGIRSGLDVFKALALGADACLLGRAWAYALAAGGETAISHMLGILQKELRVAMALTGVTQVADVNETALYRPES